MMSLVCTTHYLSKLPSRHLALRSDLIPSATGFGCWNIAFERIITWRERERERVRETEGEDIVRIALGLGGEREEFNNNNNGE